MPQGIQSVRMRVIMSVLRTDKSVNIEEKYMCKYASTSWYTQSKKNLQSAESRAILPYYTFICYLHHIFHCGQYNISEE